MTYLKIHYLSAVYTLPSCCFQISQKAACWFFFCTDLFENMLLVCCVYATITLLSNIPESSVLVFFFVMTYLKIRYLSAVYTLPTCCFQISLKAACWYFFFVMTYLKICYLSAVYTLPTRCFQISLKAACWYFFFVMTYLKIRYLSAVYTLQTHCFKFLWGRWC